MTFYENVNREGKRRRGLRCLAAEEPALKKAGYGFDKQTNNGTINGQSRFNAEEVFFRLSQEEVWYLFSGNSSTTKWDVLSRIYFLLNENLPD